jgi:hypothetical protein
VLSADGRTLRPGDAIEFYGYGMDTRYSGSAVYWLTSGLAPGKDIPTAPAAIGDASVATFLAASEIRERLTWFGAAENGDAEKFFGPAVFIQPRQRTFTLDGLDLGATGARLEVALQGITDVPHLVSVAINGLSLGTVDFQGVVPGNASFTLPPGTLVPATTSSRSSREPERTSRSSSRSGSSIRVRQFVARARSTSRSREEPRRGWRASLPRAPTCST